LEPVLGETTPLRVKALIDETELRPTDAWYDLEPAAVSWFLEQLTHAHTSP
jgi:hypothetical protein